MKKLLLLSLFALPFILNAAEALDVKKELNINGFLTLDEEKAVEEFFRAAEKERMKQEEQKEFVLDEFLEKLKEVCQLRHGTFFYGFYETYLKNKLKAKEEKRARRRARLQKTLRGWAAASTEGAEVAAAAYPEEAEAAAAEKDASDEEQTKEPVKTQEELAEERAAGEALRAERRIIEEERAEAARKRRKALEKRIVEALSAARNGQVTPAAGSVEQAQQLPEVSLESEIMSDDLVSQCLELPVDEVLKILEKMTLELFNKEHLIVREINRMTDDQLSKKQLDEIKLLEAKIEVGQERLRLVIILMELLKIRNRIEEKEEEVEAMLNKNVVINGVKDPILFLDAQGLKLLLLETAQYKRDAIEQLRINMEQLKQNVTKQQKELKGKLLKLKQLEKDEKSREKIIKKQEKKSK